MPRSHPSLTESQSLGAARPSLPIFIVDIICCFLLTFHSLTTSAHGFLLVRHPFGNFNVHVNFCANILASKFFGFLTSSYILFYLISASPSLEISKKCTSTKILILSLPFLTNTSFPFSSCS